MAFAMVLKIALGVVASLVVLLVYPSINTFLEAAMAEWTTVPEVFEAFMGLFPVIALVVIGVATLWWVVSS